MTLEEFFQENPKTALAFSGGVDSAYLLYAAQKAGANASDEAGDRPGIKAVREKFRKQQDAIFTALRTRYGGVLLDLEVRNGR